MSMVREDEDLLKKMKQVSHDSLLLRRLSQSFDWLFYRSRWSVAEGPHNTERSPALPGFVRVGLTAPATTARLKGKPLGAVLSICPELAIGSFIYWNTSDSTSDPFLVKSSLSLFLPEEYLVQAHNLVPHMTELERLYPVMSVMADTEDVGEFCAKNDAALHPQPLLPAARRQHLETRDSSYSQDRNREGHSCATWRPAFGAGRQGPVADAVERFGEEAVAGAGAAHALLHESDLRGGNRP